MKKGHVFMLDVLIAAIVLIVALALLFYAFPTKNTTVFITEQLSEDVVAVLFSTNINDFCTNPGKISGCSCPQYLNLEPLVCTESLKDTDANILSMLSEHISKGSASDQQIRDVISEIFVEKNVIDEKRFGFSFIYSNSQISAPLELYNSEAYQPVIPT